MATPLFRPARFKWCTHSSSLSWDQGWVGGCVVNLSGGEWGHGVSVKRSKGFLERGWRIYSYCADKSKDLAHDWAPPSVCVSLSEMFVSKVIRLRCAIPYTNWFRHLAIFFPACAEHFNRNLMASQTWIGSFVHFTRLIWTSCHLRQQNTKKATTWTNTHLQQCYISTYPWFAKKIINCQHLLQWLDWKLIWFKCAIRYFCY